MSAEDYKSDGNAAVSEKKWSLAETLYTCGIDALKSWQKELHVQLLSNRSLTRIHLGKLNEALDDAEKAIQIDKTFDKAYIRKCVALEALKLKRAVNSEDPSCPVLECFRTGIKLIPNSTILKEAMKISFPWLKDDCGGNNNEVSTKKKKSSVPSKTLRESCEPLDIRGAIGPHELRINGIYIPTDEIMGGWPIYRKKIDHDEYDDDDDDDEVDDDDDDFDEDDTIILEYQSALNEWMIKHISCKGTHRSFIHCKTTHSLQKPEECTNLWQGIEDKKVIIQQYLSVMTEKQRQQSDLDHFYLVKSQCIPIEIRGANGRKASGINGIYEPTDVNCGGWPIFRKVIPNKLNSDPNSLEYNEDINDMSNTMSSNVDNNINDMINTALTTLPPSTIPPPTIDDKYCVECKYNDTTPNNNATNTENSKMSLNVSMDSGNDDRCCKTCNCMDSSEFEYHDPRIWLEFNPYFKAWQIKPTLFLGTNRSWAFLVSPTVKGTRPDLIDGMWEVLDDAEYHRQDSIHLMSVEAWQVDDELSDTCWSQVCSINIRGATGLYASFINGTFDPSDTFDGGYKKRADPGCIIEYNRRAMKWQMRAHSTPFATLVDTKRLPLDQVTSSSWLICMNGNWESASHINVMSIEKRKQLDIEKYGSKLINAVPLDVRGAIGVNAFKINGIYEPANEISGGWPVYQRKGSFDYWLEYNAERQNWQIKSAANRGLDSAFAYIDASPPCPPEQCKGPWWVYTGNKNHETSNGWEIQSTVTLLTVEKRHIQDMALFDTRKTSCVPVDIRGAGGPRSNGLNGVFIPTNEMHGGWPVYQKRDDPEWWLEYDACPQKWMVRPTPCRGTTRGRAYILCDPNLRPEQAKGLWRMSDGKGGWAIEPSIYVRPESAAIEEDREKFIARRATAVAIDIRGVMRPMSYINGVYEPTNESCYGWPVYKKQNSDSQWLEYHLPSREWQIKPTSCKGTKKNWAYISSDPTHPELCTDSSWMVLISGKHMKQDNVTLVTYEQRCLEDKQLSEQRRLSYVPIIIFGAIGKHGHLINGIYEPSPTKSNGGWPSYYCHNTMMSSRSLLEFNIHAMSWTITAIQLEKQNDTDNTLENTDKCSTENVVSGGGNTKSNVSPISKSSSTISSTNKNTSPTITTTTNNNNNSNNNNNANNNSINTSSKILTESLGTIQDNNKSKLIVSCPPSLVAFLEVTKAQRPEQAKECSWKVLGEEKFEIQENIQVLTVAAYEKGQYVSKTTATSTTLKSTKSSNELNKSETTIPSKNDASSSMNTNKDSSTYQMTIEKNGQKQNINVTISSSSSNNTTTNTKNKKKKKGDKSGTSSSNTEMLVVPKVVDDNTITAITIEESNNIVKDSINVHVDKVVSNVTNTSKTVTTTAVTNSNKKNKINHLSLLATSSPLSVTTTTTTTPTVITPVPAIHTTTGISYSEMIKSKLPITPVITIASSSSTSTSITTTTNSNIVTPAKSPRIELDPFPLLSPNTNTNNGASVGAPGSSSVTLVQPSTPVTKEWANIAAKKSTKAIPAVASTITSTIIPTATTTASSTVYVSESKDVFPTLPSNTDANYPPIPSTFSKNSTILNTINENTTVSAVTTNNILNDPKSYAKKLLAGSSTTTITTTTGGKRKSESSIDSITATTTTTISNNSSSGGTVAPDVTTVASTSMISTITTSDPSVSASNATVTSTANSDMISDIIVTKGRSESHSDLSSSSSSIHLKTKSKNKSSSKDKLLTLSSTTTTTIGSNTSTSTNTSTNKAVSNKKNVKEIDVKSDSTTNEDTQKAAISIVIDTVTNINNVSAAAITTSSKDNLPIKTIENTTKSKKKKESKGGSKNKSQKNNETIICTSQIIDETLLNSETITSIVSSTTDDDSSIMVQPLGIIDTTTTTSTTSNTIITTSILNPSDDVKSDSSLDPLSSEIFHTILSSNDITKDSGVLNSNIQLNNPILDSDNSLLIVQDKDTIVDPTIHISELMSSYHKLNEQNMNPLFTPNSAVDYNSMLQPQVSLETLQNTSLNKLQQQQQQQQHMYGGQLNSMTYMNPTLYPNEIHSISNYTSMFASGSTMITPPTTTTSSSINNTHTQTHTQPLDTSYTINPSYTLFDNNKDSNSYLTHTISSNSHINQEEDDLLLFEAIKSISLDPDFHHHTSSADRLTSVVSTGNTGLDMSSTYAPSLRTLSNISGTQLSDVHVPSREYVTSDNSVSMNGWFNSSNMNDNRNNTFTNFGRTMSQDVNQGRHIDPSTLHHSFSMNQLNYSPNILNTPSNYIPTDRIRYDTMMSSSSLPPPGIHMNHSNHMYSSHIIGSGGGGGGGGILSASNQYPISSYPMTNDNLNSNHHYQQQQQQQHSQFTQNLLSSSSKQTYSSQGYHSQIPNYNTIQDYNNAPLLSSSSSSSFLAQLGGNQNSSWLSIPIMSSSTYNNISNSNSNSNIPMDYNTYSQSPIQMMNASTSNINTHHQKVGMNSYGCTNNSGYIDKKNFSDLLSENVLTDLLNSNLPLISPSTNTFNQSVQPSQQNTPQFHSSIMQTTTNAFDRMNNNIYSENTTSSNTIQNISNVYEGRVMGNMYHVPSDQLSTSTSTPTETNSGIPSHIMYQTSTNTTMTTHNNSHSSYPYLNLPMEPILPSTYDLTDPNPILIKESDLLLDSNSNHSVASGNNSNSSSNCNSTGAYISNDGLTSHTGSSVSNSTLSGNGSSSSSSSSNNNKNKSYHNIELSFTATLWGRQVFVRKLNQNTTGTTNTTNTTTTANSLMNPNSINQIPMTTTTTTTTTSSVSSTCISPTEDKIQIFHQKLRLDFLRELQVLTDFRHTNILPLQGFSFWPMLLVYPVLPHKIKLSDFLYSTTYTPQFQQLSWKVKLRMLCNIISALAYVHNGYPELKRPGIVHRNICPNNIMISIEDGDALLCDFRQSRELDNDIHSLNLLDSAPNNLIESLNLKTNMNLDVYNHTSGNTNINMKCADMRNEDDWCIGVYGYIDPLYTKTRLYFPSCDMYSIGVLLLQVLSSTQPSATDVERLVEHFKQTTQFFYSPQFHAFGIQSLSPAQLHELSKFYDTTLNPTTAITTATISNNNSGTTSISTDGWNSSTILHLSYQISQCLYMNDSHVLQRVMYGMTAENLQLTLLDIANQK